MQTELIERNGKKVVIIRFPENFQLIRSDLPFRKTLDEVVKDLPLDCDLLINCSGLVFYDSFGAGEILFSYITFQKRQRRVILAAVSPKILFSFQMMKLDRVLEIVPDEETGLSILTETGE